MKTQTPAAAKAERLFPFILRARILLVGQQVILRSKSRLQFVLITKDISERGRSETLRKLKHYPIVQRFRSADIEKHFGLRGVKLLGFRKSGLAKSLYAELKRHRINEPHQQQQTPPASAGKTKPSAAAGKRTAGMRRSASAKKPQPIPRRKRRPPAHKKNGGTA